MKNELDLSDMVIIAFVAIIFVTGAVVVYRFMKRKF